MIQFLQLTKKIASLVSSISFFRFGLPVIAVICAVFFFYFGIKGVVKRETVLLMDMRNMAVGAISLSDQTSYGQVQGVTAIILGIFYLIVGTALTFFLLPICYYIWFNK